MEGVDTGVELPPTSPVTRVSPDSPSAPGEDRVRVISSANLPPPPLARWVVPVLLATFGLHLLDHHWSLPMALSLFLALAGGISTAAGAWWTEARVDRWARRLPRPGRVLVHFFQPLVMLVLTGLLTALSVRYAPHWATRYITPLIAFGGLWHTGAAVGTLVQVSADAVVRRVFLTFRSRLVTVSLVLVLMGYGAALMLGLGAFELYSLALDDPGSVSQRVLQFADPSQLLGLEALLSAPARLWTSLIGLMGLLALPAVASACSKLAETALDMLRPLTTAIREVGHGARDVRVQVNGSVEFVEAAHTFNGMVRALALADRMERAFGAYVSVHLLERIRAQHGEAGLPPLMREATVFFADIRGFTGLSERLSPQQTVDVLNRYFQHVVDLIDVHQGYLNKFVGDAVMVVFNGPVDQPDHAERAVRCALELQHLVSELNAKEAFPEVGSLEVGAGVSTGPMVCGNIGGSQQMEYTVIGDAVNLASRLTDLAPPGEVWISEQTRRSLPDGFELDDLPALLVKGKEAPVRPFRAQSAPEGWSPLRLVTPQAAG